jgi:mycoredoxin
MWGKRRHSTDKRLPPTLERLRKGALFFALGLATLLFTIDRYAAWMHRPAADSTRIVLYTTSWCGYCAALRAQLHASGIVFTEYDVEKSLGGQMGFWALRARGVPVSVIGPQVVYGYQEDALESALSRVGHPVDLVSLKPR